ncbi:MAG: hypothetical protein HEQ23_07670 [Tepidisphaera sp.]
MRTRITDVFSIPDPNDPSLPVGTRILADNTEIRAMGLTPGCEVRVRRKDGAEALCTVIHIEERWGQLAIVVEGVVHQRFACGDMILTGEEASR